MKTLIVIPARYQSQRFPGKPLVSLTGADGQSRTLIERSWRAAMVVGGVERVVVATDDTRISDACATFGAETVMTPESCQNGTERCAATLAAIDGDFDVVVNLQGDAPLTPAWYVEALVAAMAEGDVAMATPVLRCDAAAVAGFLEDRAAGRVGGTTAVFDASHRALYFSKEVLPYTGRPFGPDEEIPVFHHVGVYAYTPEALARYATFDPGPLERWEGLEQLRFMENGIPVQCVEVASRGRAFWELNNPADVPRIEAIMAREGLS